MLVKKTKLLLILAAITLLICIITNMLGISIKISNDKRTVAYSYPADISLCILNGTHQVSIFVMHLDKGAEHELISLERRRDFRGFYWEEGIDSLWVNGDFGISCYEETDSGWEEYAIVQDENGVGFLVKTSNTSVILDRRINIPRPVLNDLKNGVSNKIVFRI